MLCLISLNINQALVSPFTHEQLRNTIEYFDSNNNPEFKAKKHRLFPDERIIRIYEY